jgi:hypothetical protein
MYFVWVSEQTAIISVYNRNWLVFVTETECVCFRYELSIFVCIRLISVVNELY